MELGEARGISQLDADRDLGFRGMFKVILRTDFCCREHVRQIWPGVSYASIRSLEGMKRVCRAYRET